MGRAPDPSHGTVSHHRRRRFDVRVVTHRRRSRLRLRDWRIRSKLATVLVIPSVAFLVLAAVQVYGLVGQTNVLAGFDQQVAIGRQLTDLVDRLQQERDRTAGELAQLRAAGGRADRDAAIAALRPLIAATDDAVERLQDAARPLRDSDVSWRVSYGKVLQAYQQIIYIRGAVPAAVLSSETILGNYDRAIDALLGLLAEPSPGPDRPDLTDAVLRYVQFARAKESASRIRAELYAAARGGGYDGDAQVRLSDLRAQQLTAIGAFQAAATAAQLRRYQEAAADPGFADAVRLEERTVPSAKAAPEVLPAEEWWSASQRRQDLLRQVEAAVLDDGVRRAHSASTAQLRQTLLVAVAVLAVLLAALLASAIIGRSIARSLQLLRGQAMRIAQVELPDALERLRRIDDGVSNIEVAPAVIRSLDEIGELAEAFVAVHRSAVNVAVEQAVMRRNVNAMFVNLARRSQVLVERQLELLDELEREESDPDQLENLFKLDHLAARMRRNDESLLVLAGTEATRRWNRSVTLSTVLLAASAEIEQYQRVRQEAGEPLQVVGHVIADLVHLLAELLENATAFSRPDTQVRVVARAADGGAVIEIVDEGLGMTPEALEQANRLLADPPAADVAASERMGLFVVSHLAARHDIQVRLQAGQHGLVAVVRLPAELLAPAAPDTAGLPGVRRVTATTGQFARPIGAARLELPVAGRPPEHTTAPNPPRPVPTRAEDVLSPEDGAAAPAPTSTWWSRQPSPTPAAPPAPAPPAAPVTGGVNQRGLPVRVPMAQLPMVTESARPSAPAPRAEPDPDAVGGMLSRLYSGVRRAEIEDTTEMTTPPAGGRSEGMQQ